MTASEIREAGYHAEYYCGSCGWVPVCISEADIDETDGTVVVVHDGEEFSVDLNDPATLRQVPVT